jgi:hypothetical protein
MRILRGIIMRDFGMSLWRKRTGGRLPSGGVWRPSFQEFEAIAPGVCGKKAARAGDRGVIRNFDSASEQGLPQLLEVVDDEGGMRFLGRAEIWLDADVELLGATFEPAAAAGAKREWFVNLAQAEKIAIKFAGCSFTALGSGDLEVVEACNLKVHARERIPARS